MNNMIIFSILVLGFIISLMMALWCFINWMLIKYILPVKQYLTEITGYTMSELKKPHSILYRQTIIKDLYIMKKILKIAILMVSICICIVIVFLTVKNYDYITNYFKIKQQKLELASEEKVTEMLNTIEFQKAYTDSIVSVSTQRIDSLIQVTNELRVENALLLERNKNLNYMINNLNKIISTHGMDPKK